MQRLVYLLAYPFLWLISKLPFSLFYLFSDFVFFLVYYLIRYRRKTVANNLCLVFPEKSKKELKRIEKKSYHHLCDQFLEMAKSLSISNEQLLKRFTFSNVDEIERIRKMDKSIILLYGHYANYEWVNALQLYGLDYNGFGVYKKLKNPYFDKMIHRIRGRFNGELIATNVATKQITKNERKKRLGIYAIIGDQSPKLDRAWYWTKFMGVRSPAFTGGEKLAKRLDMAVVYFHVEKIKRGHYHATFKTISDNPSEYVDYRITETFLRELETQIREQPEYYLWTHKRWKHKDAPAPKDAVENFE